MRTPNCPLPGSCFSSMHHERPLAWEGNPVLARLCAAGNSYIHAATGKRSADDLTYGTGRVGSHARGRVPSAYSRQCSRYAASWAAANSTTLDQSQEGASSFAERRGLKVALNSRRVAASICLACALPTTSARYRAEFTASSWDSESISSFKSWGISSRTTTDRSISFAAIIRSPSAGDKCLAPSTTRWPLSWGIFASRSRGAAGGLASLMSTKQNSVSLDFPLLILSRIAKRNRASCSPSSNTRHRVPQSRHHSAGTLTTLPIYGRLPARRVLGSPYFPRA